MHHHHGTIASHQPWHAGGITKGCWLIETLTTFRMGNVVVIKLLRALGQLWMRLEFISTVVHLIDVLTEPR